jgi:hypothetical protein
VNLAWNLYRAEPVPEVERLAKSADPVYAPDPPPAAPGDSTAAAPAPAPAAPPAEARRKAEAPPPPKLEDRLARESELAGAAARERDQASAEAKQQEQANDARQAYAEAQRRETLQAQDSAAAGAAARSAAPAAAMAPTEAPPMTEAQKIERLIAYVAQLDDVAFIRNGKEYNGADAADHMRLKLKRAGDRVKTAEDFIRLCASFSTQTGEAYLIRFPDGRTRTAEDVLREQLATMP